MTLNSGFRAKLKAALIKHEEDIDYFYRDSVGQVTIGIGNLVANEAQAKALHLSHRSNNRRASTDEIAAAFRRVANEPYLHKRSDGKMKAWPAGHYSALNNDLFMPPTERNLLLDRHIDQFYAALVKIFRESNGYKLNYDEFPERVRLALFDMIFNLGAKKFPSHWPRFVKALKHALETKQAMDWQKVADESARPQLGPTRNGYVYNLLSTGGFQTPSDSANRPSLVDRPSPIPRSPPIPPIPIRSP